MYLSTHGTTDVLNAAVQIVEDPHLSEVACHVLRLAAIQEGRIPGPKCTRVPTNFATTKGIGLRYAVVPLRTFVAAREHPWVGVVTGAGVVLGLIGLGYVLGRRR